MRALESRPRQLQTTLREIKSEGENIWPNCKLKASHLYRNLSIYFKDFPHRGLGFHFCNCPRLSDCAASVRKVLEMKTLLRTCEDKCISSIWIRRSKTNEQRMLERNCAMLLREVDKNDQGRIVRVKQQPSEPTWGSQEDINSTTSQLDWAYTRKKQTATVLSAMMCI